MHFKVFLITTAFFILLCMPVIISAQNSKESFVSDRVERLFNKSTPNAKETYQTGMQILKLAKTSKEFSYGYSLVADGFYKKEDYSRAIIFYKKVDSISKLLKDDERRFMTHLFMTGIYNKVGLLTHAKESLNLCKTLSAQSDIPYAPYYLKHAETSLLEFSYQYCEAVPKRTALLAEISAIVRKESSDPSILAISHVQLAYDYLKCEKILKAHIHLKKADSIISTKEYIGNSIIIANYKMVKGMYAAENHDVRQARIYFDDALENSNKNNLDIEKVKILEERINYDIDDASVRKIYVKALNELQLKRKKEAAKIIKQEDDSKNRVISMRGKVIKLLLAMSIICVLLFFLLTRFSAIKRKTAKDKYRQLFEQFQAKNSALKEQTQESATPPLQNIGQSNLITVDQSDHPIQKASVKKILSNEKEIDLLAKLKCFEAGTDFLQSNFSISIMASQFDTNSKYINFILQKHRNQLFSDYINSLRINYIINLLYHDSAYLNYKISYLSELCGYSSHSRFTWVFKKETGISPSDFIAQLSKNKSLSD